MRRLLGMMTMLLGIGGAMSSCDSAIYDEQGDCSVSYRVYFTYDMNLNFANAFAHNVKSLTLYVFNPDGTLVTTKTDDSPALASPDYYMDLSIAPGKYDLLVWATGQAAGQAPTAFDVAKPGLLTAMGATLPLLGDEGEVTPESGFYVDRDIIPLFHGIRQGVDFPDTYGDVDLGVISLIKDTNVVQVLLQNIDGTPIEQSDFDIYITAANNQLDYLNRVTSTTPFGYRPWAVSMTSASFDTPDTDKPDQSKASRTQTEANGMLAEFTMGRLMADRSPRLVVRRNTDGSEIIRINLIQYLLMVKGEYLHSMTNQEYLDIKDSFTMMFFVDKDSNWYIKGGVYINGWRIVPPQDEEL